jgi:hypothetical protein
LEKRTNSRSIQSSASRMIGLLRTAAYSVVTPAAVSGKVGARRFAVLVAEAAAEVAEGRAPRAVVRAARSPAHGAAEDVVLRV